MIEAYFRTTGVLVVTPRDEANQPIPGATVQVTYLLDGVEVPGVTWPQAVAEDPPGEYTYTPPHTLLERGKTYTAVVEAEKDGDHAYAEVPVPVVVARGTR